jgi:hypothetical protein
MHAIMAGGVGHWQSKAKFSPYKPGLQLRLFGASEFTMRAISVIMLLSLIVVLAGCKRITSSGIPMALKTDSLLKTAGSSMGITLSYVGDGEARDTRSVEVHSRYNATVSSGTSGQLLASYQKEVESMITRMGGVIHGRGVRGGEDDVQDFSFTYGCRRNEGLVRVFSFTGTNGEAQIVSFCYEHVR